MSTDLINWSQKLALELSSVGWHVEEDGSIWHNVGKIAAILRREAAPVATDLKHVIEVLQGKHKELSDERDEMLSRLREIGRMIGCGHVDDPDGRQRLVSCLRETIERGQHAIRYLHGDQLKG